MTIMATVESGARLFEGRLSDSVQKLWLRYYPVSRHQRFKELLLKNIRPADHVLEIGAGSGKFNQNHFDLRGRVARYVGADPDRTLCLSRMNPSMSYFITTLRSISRRRLLAIGRLRGFSNRVGCCCFKRRAATGTPCWPLR